jgi:hypothetical protein
MPASINDAEVRAVFEGARAQTKRIIVGGNPVEIPTPFPSPEDWRDQWIYFLMVDRFNNPEAPPHFAPFDGMHGVFQGGTLNGVREQLDYLQQLGVGALWGSIRDLLPIRRRRKPIRNWWRTSCVRWWMKRTCAGST